jgi:hypothetical protein
MDDRMRPGRPPIELSGAIMSLPSDEPFLSARVLTVRLLSTHQTIKRVLVSDLGMRKFGRRWIPHDLSEVSRRERVLKANLLLEELWADEGSPSSCLYPEISIVWPLQISTWTFSRINQRLSGHVQTGCHATMADQALLLLLRFEIREKYRTVPVALRSDIENRRTAANQCRCCRSHGSLLGVRHHRDLLNAQTEVRGTDPFDFPIIQIHFSLLFPNACLFQPITEATLEEIFQS